MEISSSASSHGLCLSRSLLPRASRAATTLSILTASATVRSHPYRSASAPRSLTRRRRLRNRRGSMDGGDEEGFSGDDGPFGGGGGGRGWGYGGGSGRPEWEDDSGSSSWSSSSSSSDPAFDFVYEVVCWIALSNCAHFAVRKVGRFLKGKAEAMPVIC